MFGTYQEEDEDVVYGITVPLRSWSPLWGNVHYFVHMYELSKQLQGFSKLQVLWRGPAWNPMPVTQQKPKVAYSKYDVGSSLGRITWVYIIIQYATAVILRKRLEEYYTELSSISALLLAFAIIFDICAMGAIMMYKWSRSMERLRIASTWAIMMIAVFEVGRNSYFPKTIITAWAFVSVLMSNDLRDLNPKSM